MNPQITVGILRAATVRFTLAGPFSINGTAMAPGHYEATTDGSVIRVGGISAGKIDIVPTAPDSLFTLHDVVIGIQFHWQRHQSQSFRGQLCLIPDEGMVQVINVVDIEIYLESVVSSEMSASASTEFIKAHAILSRSWLMAQLAPDESLMGYNCTETAEERIKWYDRQAHSQFHVCADDHCQRYQGCTRSSRPEVAEAVAATAGEVLTCGGHLCDARFSKCCGGVTERFSTCWQPVDFPYLQSVTDAPDNPPVADLTNEASARQWILSSPEAFCVNPGEEVLQSVLNDFDQETADFARWRVEYSADELAEIVSTRSGIDLGRIVSLTPLHRGPSGRIDLLRIEGTRHNINIGKELEIRRTLSRSHLYSSAFIATPLAPDSDGIATRWIIEGAGWGHGVGLCQIGAATMAARGYDYRSILFHYFTGTEITKAY